jgi:drug/metabolite transporter (DMT)-like permease
VADAPPPAGGPPNPGFGWRYIVVAAFLFSVMSLLVKVVGQRIASLEIVLVRSCLTLLFSALLLARGRVSPWGSHHCLLFLRGLFGTIALSCFFYSVTQLPLAVATVVQFTNPIFTALLAAFFLRERAGGRLWLAIALGLAGVLAITRPSFLFGGEMAAALPSGVMAIALGGALATGAAYVLVRKLASLENELVIVFYFPLVAVPGILAILPEWVWPTPREWLLMLGVALTAQYGQIYLTRGFHRLAAAPATVVLYSQILFATTWGLLLLGEKPALPTLIGASLVLVGTVLSAAGSRARTPPDE